MSVFLPVHTSMEDLEARSRNASSSLLPHSDGGRAGASGALPLLQWVASQQESYDHHISTLVAEEDAVRGECEYLEWSAFLDIVRSFHLEGCAVQLHQLRVQRESMAFQEEERVARREATMEEEAERHVLNQETADAHLAMRRYLKRLREARQNIEYEELESRESMLSTAGRIHAAVTFCLRLRPQPTVDDITSLLFDTWDHFSSDLETLTLLAGALVAWTSTQPYAQLFGQHGGIQRIKTLLQTFPHCTTLVEMLIIVLFHCSMVHVNQCKLEPVVTEVLHVMESHPRSLDVQYRGLQCLASVTQLTKAFRLAILKSAGALETIIESLGLWLHHAKVCLQTCKLIRNVVRETIAHRHVAEHGLSLMIHAANLHRIVCPTLDLCWMLW